MRSIVAIGLLGLPAACGEGTGAASELRARQEAACVAAIAAHVGRPRDEVRARWVGRAGGVARVEARDGARLHVCDVDRSARVLDYAHPLTP